uniref:Secreted protein n=1 Tax=Mesocestoides corti TaxID=53468 RepID=A0A5K3FQW6_MESCO
MVVLLTHDFVVQAFLNLCRIPEPKCKYASCTQITNQNPTPGAVYPSQPRAGHAAQWILLLIHVFLFLAAYLPRIPFKRRETEDWLRSMWTNMSVS